MNENERQEWNAAVARGDESEIRRLQDYHLRQISKRQLADWAPQERCR